MNNIQYRFSDSTDLESVVDLLKSCDLPTSDIITSKVQLLLAFDNDTLIGSVGVEHFGAHTLLRSFAVNNQYRNKSIGKELLNRMIDYLKQCETTKMHLLTTTADKYFLNKGFVIQNKDGAPECIKNTAEFSSICPDSAVYMVCENLLSKNSF